MEAAQEANPSKETSQAQKEKDILSWTAPARPFKRRNRKFYVTLIAIAAIVGLVLFLAEGYMPVILIISLVFLFYVLNTVEPENLEYKITSKGIKVSDKTTDWSLFTRWWLTKRFDSKLLVLEMRSLPGRMELVYNPEDEGKIRKTLSQHLPEEEASPSFLDRTAVWIANKMPQ